MTASVTANAIAKMQADLSELRGERARIDEKLSKLESALQIVFQYASEDEKPAMLAQLSLTKTGSKREQIFAAVLAILENGSPRHTPDLLKELSAQGIEVGGDKPEANLSAYLSRAKHYFVNDRRYGWSLKKQTPEDVAASSGASTKSSVEGLV